MKRFFDKMDAMAATVAGDSVFRDIEPRHVFSL